MTFGGRSSRARAGISRVRGSQTSGDVSNIRPRGNKSDLYEYDYCLVYSYLCHFESRFLLYGSFGRKVFVMLAMREKQNAPSGRVFYLNADGPFTPTGHLEKEKEEYLRWVGFGHDFHSSTHCQPPKRRSLASFPQLPWMAPGGIRARYWLHQYYYRQPTVLALSIGLRRHGIQRRGSKTGAIGNIDAEKSKSKKLACRVHVSQPQRGYVLRYLAA